jgi:hypothetical protein
MPDQRLPKYTLTDTRLKQLLDQLNKAIPTLTDKQKEDIKEIT